MATIKSKYERDFRLTKGQTQTSSLALDFNKMKIGSKTFRDDVTLTLESLKKPERKFSKERVRRAIETGNLKELRQISNYFFNTSGIYSRLCRYMAFLYRYDWFVIPVVTDNKVKQTKIIEGWYKAALYLENSRLKKNFGEIALKVIKNGCYYGYRIDQKNASYLQELPVDYCRSRYELNGQPIIEFNIKYFNDCFSDISYRLRVIKMFPKEVQKAYVAYQNGTLVKDFQGDDTGWFPLTGATVKFNLSNCDAPLFASVIPAIMDLDDAKDLDKQKQAQQLLRIIIQKLPLDKNYDMVFDMGEAQAIHNNAVTMLADAIGVDVLTTFADVDVADMSDKSNVSSVDILERVERTLYNEAGVSQMQFNTSGNLALEKSILNDEATMFDLILQFEQYAESLLGFVNKSPKRLVYRVQMLPTTIYNYKDLASVYKEQTMLGYSKLLPPVALGQSQSMVIATVYFENELMNLDELFIAPSMSSTQSSDNSDDKEESNSDTTTIVDPTGDGNQGGRPELPDDQKSEKTIQNKESEG